jgi:hypothetical protein
MNQFVQIAFILSVCCATPSLGQPSARSVSCTSYEMKTIPPRQKDHEDEVARLVDQVRSAAKLRSLKRTRPSVWDLQLTCTAALENKAMFDDLELRVFKVHASQDLVNNSAFRDLLTFGSNHDPKAERHYQSFWDKEFPNYSVIVFLDPDSSSTNSDYYVGIARHESRIQHLQGCLFTEDGCNDRWWKSMVSPICESLR